MPDHLTTEQIELLRGLARRYDTREMSYEAGDPVAQTYKHAAANLRNLANNLKGNDQ